jgi:NitT/TauT family transport system ATP-binding protein
VEVAGLFTCGFRAPYVILVSRNNCTTYVHQVTLQGRIMNRGRQGTRVELRAVRKTFKGSDVTIGPIDLVINGGEFVSIVGSSGCGKSTLLRILAGLETCEGQVEVQSPEVKPVVSFVFQDATLIPWSSVAENVGLPLLIQNCDRREQRERVRSALDLVGLASHMEVYPHQLSGGMKMRVSLARALVLQPTLLLLDEPFAALDEWTRWQLQDEIRALRDKFTMTVVLVTHAMSEALYLSDRVGLMSHHGARSIRKLLPGMGSLRPSLQASSGTENLRASPEFNRALSELQDEIRALQGGSL